MAGILTNALEAGLDSVGDDSEEVLARDSNAATSVLWPEQRWVGRLLSVEYDVLDNTPIGLSTPSALCHALRALPVIQGVLVALAFPGALAESAGMADETNKLLHVAGTLAGLGWVAFSLVVPSALEALRPGGALEQLGAGEVMISAEDAASDARWRKGLLATSSAFCVLFGLPYIASAVLELPPLVPPGALMLRILWGEGGLLICTVLPVAVNGWWASMRTASCLCRDETIETIHAIETTDPASDEWDAAVAERALGLIPKLRLLSDGWSGGLIGFGSFIWLNALACFVYAINAPFNDRFDAANDLPPGTIQAVWIVIGASFFPLPFLLVLDVAHTSTYCDLLVEKLNSARVRYGPESDPKITWLETSLLRLVRPSVLHLGWLQQLICPAPSTRLTNHGCVRVEQEARPGL
jgi:hypothetical protein